ncbi:MAG: plasmid mobilization protein [Gemmatimonadota bacterium]
MDARIHITVHEHEKERFRSQAKRVGKSLSEWLREAAREKLAASAEVSSLDSVAELDAFFEDCDRVDAVGKQPEPDWAMHQRLIERSLKLGGREL